MAVAMARYRIVYWRDIPSLVEATDGERTARVPLSQRFQDLIDAVAMREGASDAEAYLEGWSHGPDEERCGSVHVVAQQVAAEVEERFADVMLRRLPPPA
jgi:hypothetical protein